MADGILQAVFDAVEEVNLQLGDDERIARDVDAVLVGENGQLDSLGLVNLVLAVEEKIEEQFAVPINLTDEAVMERWSDIFQTIGSLRTFLCGRLGPDL